MKGRYPFYDVSLITRIIYAGSVENLTREGTMS